MIFNVLINFLKFKKCGEDDMTICLSNLDIQVFFGLPAMLGY